MRRVVVVGNSGSGKTRLASELARRLGVPHLELDSIYHQAGWAPLPADEFRSTVAAFSASDGWVIDGNYSSASDITWPRADSLVWVDPPLAVTMWRLTRRTAARVVTRRALWNGNREMLRNVLSRDPMRSILRWAWQQHPVLRARYEAMIADPAHTHLDVRRLRDKRAVGALLREASAGFRPVA